MRGAAAQVVQVQHPGWVEPQGERGIGDAHSGHGGHPAGGACASLGSACARPAVAAVRFVPGVGRPGGRRPDFEDRRPKPGQVQRQGHLIEPALQPLGEVVQRRADFLVRHSPEQHVRQRLSGPPERQRRVTIASQEDAKHLPAPERLGQRVEDGTAAVVGPDVGAWGVPAQRDHAAGGQGMGVQCLQALLQRHEALFHLAVHLVGAAAADRVVRLLLQQQPPGLLQGARRPLRSGHGAGQQRLDRANQAVLDLVVQALQGPACGQHVGQHEGLAVGTQLAPDPLAPGGGRQQRQGVLRQRGGHELEGVLRAVESGQARSHVRARQQVVATRGEEEPGAALRACSRRSSASSSSCAPGTFSPCW